MNKKSCLLGKLRSGVGATWADTAPVQGMPDEEWNTAVRRRLRLKVDVNRMCASGMLRDGQGDHTGVSEKKSSKNEDTRQSERCETYCDGLMFTCE